MANSVESTPVVDYTSRDYQSLRADLITRVKDNLPRWTGDEAPDFGLALIEAFAYMGDVVNYYVDRVANESYLPTATLRQSVLNIARNYGYFPSGYRAATATVQFTNADSVAVVLPAGTELLAEVTTGEQTFDLIWSLAEEVTVPAQVASTPGTITATAYQYEDVSHRAENRAQGVNDIDGELVALSDGSPEQLYRLFEDQIVDGSVKVWVQNGEIYEPWTEVAHLTDFGPFDQVFTVISDASDYVYIQFGDGISGAIPNKFASIKASYYFGGGAAGNISTNLITQFYRVPGLTDTQVSTLASTMEVTNTSTGIGGSAPESTDSIRANAPAALTALNRAVSLKDYASLALQVGGVGKARAAADLWTSVTVYIAPQRNASSVDQFPGYNDDPAAGGILLPEWYELKSAAELFFTDKTQIGTSVTVSPPTYVPVTVQVFYTKLEQYTNATLETLILKATLDAFRYNDVEFGAVIHPEEIETAIRSIDGVVNARVTAMYRKGGTAERTILIGKPNEIFVALTDDIGITAYSTNSKLTTLTSTVGTIAPTFSPSFYNYAITVANGTTSLSLTPTLQAATSTLKVNGVVKTSGSSTSINTPVGVTVVAIGVAAADGLTFSDYTVTITRNA